MRAIKSLLYPLFPSSSAGFHAKRRKGILYQEVDSGVLECQREQDRIFWHRFLHPGKGGKFLEIGAGDGVVGSHTLGLELLHQWQGALWEPHELPCMWAAKARQCPVWSEEEKPGLVESVQLLAIHRPSEFPSVWTQLRAGRFKPVWVIVENRDPDPHWCRLLESSGYRLKFFFHDDEYFQLTRR